MEDPMPKLTTNNTASELARSAPSTALQVAARELELYDTGNVAGADEVFAPDLVDHTSDAVSAIDRMRQLVAAVRDGFTDVQHRVTFYEEAPGGWLVLHWHMTGTHTGEAFGLPASGNPVAIDIMHIADGKIREIYHVEELLKLTQQMSSVASS
jgi:predicted ester cyclase